MSLEDLKKKKKALVCSCVVVIANKAGYSLYIGIAIQN